MQTNDGLNTKHGCEHVDTTTEARELNAGPIVIVWVIAIFLFVIFGLAAAIFASSH